MKVITCGFPPLEDREKSLKLLAAHDFFGCGLLTKEETVSSTKLIVNIDIIKTYLVHILKVIEVGENHYELFIVPIC